MYEDKEVRIVLIISLQIHCIMNEMYWKKKGKNKKRKQEQKGKEECKLNTLFPVKCRDKVND
jgi:hypothetical protein